MARLVDGLETLRGEFNTVNPKRDRSSDGWIGDDRHALTISDHNPDHFGLVRAIDVDKDGVPMATIIAWLVAECRAGRETRLQYVIYNRTIWSRSWGWKARRYTGANPHTRHAHFSARHAAVATDGRPWGVAAKFGPQRATESAPRPKPSKPAAKPGGHPAGSRRLMLRDPVMSGADVRYVQEWIGAKRAGAADGKFGPRTVAAVKWYQGMRGLAADGIVGPVTWRHLGVRYTGPS